MSQVFITDKEILTAAIADVRLDTEAVYAYCRSREMTFPDLSNALSLTIARRFDQGLMSFGDADAAMNAIWGVMVDYLLHTPSVSGFWDPAESIYFAFDAGEWTRDDGKDPVEEFTRPAVKEILKGA